MGIYAYELKYFDYDFVDHRARGVVVASGIQDAFSKLYSYYGEEIESISIVETDADETGVFDEEEHPLLFKGL